MKRSVSALIFCIAGATAASAQFLNASFISDGVAVSLGAGTVYPAVVLPGAPALVPAVIPMMPGYVEHHHHHPRYHKAVVRPAAGARIATPIGEIYFGTPARVDYYDDWDDDDYEDYYKHMRKHMKKQYKKYKKHHKHHHHDD